MSIAIFAGYAIIPAAIFMRVVGNDYAEKARHQFSRAIPLSDPPRAMLVGIEPRGTLNGKEAR
jgi:hypothetical protein